MLYDPSISFGELILCYEKYIDDSRSKGKKPLSFLHFMVGRYK